MSLESLKEVTALTVFKDGAIAGRLERTGEGVVFSYSSEYLRKNKEDKLTERIFYSLPLRSAHYSYRGENLPPEFAGLLPEGLRLNALIRTVKTSPSDLFSLAASLGNDVPGDIHLETEIPEEHELDENDIYTEFESLEFDSLFKGSISRTSRSAKQIDTEFSGIQPKVSARIVSFPVNIAGRRKRFILKLPSKEFPGSVRNEYFFMRLAKKAGLEAANVSLVADRKGKEALLVQRFDRVYSREKKRFIKLHTEDACQFLRKYPQDKYRISFREIAGRIYELASAPRIEALKLLDLVIYSYIIGNGDLHGKNISLITDVDKRVKLSPCYDLLSTLPYGDQSLAILFEGNDKNISTALIDRFCKAYGVSTEIAHSRIRKIAGVVESSIKEFSEIGFESKREKQLRSWVEKRVSEFR